VRYRAAVVGRLPDFIIIGAPRTGTTALFDCLGRHPDVVPAHKKELHFFDHKWDRGLDWYTSQFAHAPAAAVTGEATPRYMANRTAMERLVATVPEALLICVLRDPVERAHSHFYYRRARGLATGSFEAAIDRELAGAEGAEPLLGFGMYDAQLAFIESLAPSMRMQIVWHEELMAGAAEVAAALQIAPGRLEMRPAVNSAARFRSLRARSVGQRLPRRAEKLLEKVNRVRVEYPPLLPQTRERLIAHFADDRHRLELRTGRDLSSWGAGV
jgi:hypothetical protein